MADHLLAKSAGGANPTPFAAMSGNGRQARVSGFVASALQGAFSPRENRHE